MPRSGDQKRGQNLMPRPPSSLQQFSLIIQLNSVTQWQIQREGLGGPDPPIRPLRLKFFHRQDHISLFNSYWLIFLSNVHFIFHLNLIPGIFKNVIVLMYTPTICSPPLAKQYFQSQQQVAFTDWETRCRLCSLSDWWEGLWGRSNLPQKSSTVLSEPIFVINSSQAKKVP